MTEQSLVHNTFTLERKYSTSPEQVFAAWRDPVAKAAWFASPGSEHELDFRVGGRELTRNEIQPGNAMVFDSVYLDIVEGTRIVYSSTLSSNDVLCTASITTVEISAAADGAVLVLTESDVFLDGRELPEWRQTGTGDWLDKLGSHLD